MSDTATAVKSALTLSEAAEANLKTGVLLMCKEALVTAIQDRRLHRGHLSVLATLVNFMSSRTAKAWPGRAAIAAINGMPVKTVSNLLLELRNFGYLIAEREAVEEAGNRSLTVYTFGNIDHETIRREITSFVESVRVARSAEQLRGEPEKVPPQRDYQSRPNGTISPAPTGLVSDKVPPQRVEKSRPGGDSNLYKELEESKRVEKPPPTKVGSATIESSFEEFWSTYPPGRKRGKGAALDVFEKIVTGRHKSRKASAMALIDGARRYAATKPDPEYTPMPETWLNQGRWLDDPAGKGGEAIPWWQKPDLIAAMTPERWRKGIAQYAIGTWSVKELGPPPGHPECIVPQALVKELQLTEKYDPRGFARGGH